MLGSRNQSGRLASGRAILVGLFACAVATAGLLAGASDGTGAQASSGSGVRVVIDYGNGVEKRYHDISWRAGFTAFDVLKVAAEMRPTSQVTAIGSGETLLVTSIDGFANGVDDRNWIFSVNDQKGRRSSAITAVNAGDTLRWSYEPWPGADARKGSAAP